MYEEGVDIGQQQQLEVFSVKRGDQRRLRISISTGIKLGLNLTEKKSFSSIFDSFSLSGRNIYQEIFTLQYKSPLFCPLLIHSLE